MTWCSVEFLSHLGKPICIKLTTVGWIFALFAVTYDWYLGPSALKRS